MKYRWPSPEDWASWPQARKRTEALRLLTQAVRHQIGHSTSPSSPVSRALDLATEAVRDRRHSRVEAVEILYDLAEHQQDIRDLIFTLHDLAYGQSRTGDPAVSTSPSNTTMDIATTRAAAKGKLRYLTRRIRKAYQILVDSRGAPRRGDGPPPASVLEELDAFLERDDHSTDRPTRSALTDGEREESEDAQRRRRIRGEEAV